LFLKLSILKVGTSGKKKKPILHVFQIGLWARLPPSFFEH